MKYLASSIAALAALAILPHQASAVTAAPPDLIVGFQASGGTGSALNLEIDLGSATQFYGTGIYATTSGKQTLVHLGTDLSNTYGASWGTTGLVSFGVIGAELQNIGSLAPDGEPKGTLFASKPESTPGTATTPWSNATQVAQKTAAANVINLYNGYNGTNGTTVVTPGSAPGALTIAKSDANSYTTQENNGPNGSQFQFFSVVPGIDHTINLSLGLPVSDLYQIWPNNTSPDTGVNLLGAFELTSSGDLLFSNDVTAFAAAPEPSSAALLVSAASLLGFWRRRPARA